MADEAIKKNEKESHDAHEEAKQVEEAAERAMIIGNFHLKLIALLFIFTFEFTIVYLLQSASLPHRSHTTPKLIQ
jgi:hypothetical protein